MENTQPIYDADATQTLPLKVERRGKLYAVRHCFQSISDDVIANFERARDVRMSDADSRESDDANAMAMTDDSFNAAIAGWDACAEKVEGYRLDTGRDDWKSQIAQGDKAFAFQTLLSTDFEELPVGLEDEGCPPDADETSVYRLRALFNGTPVTLTHTLRPASRDEMGKFQKLMRRALVVRGTRFGQTDQRIPSRARELGELYNQVMVETDGYNGRIPLHHRMAIVLRHFRNQAEMDAGN